MIACMGGFCRIRDRCPHHVAASSPKPAERLCLKGQDGTRLVESSPFRSVIVEIFARREPEQTEVVPA